MMWHFATIGAIDTHTWSNSENRGGWWITPQIRITSSPKAYFQRSHTPCWVVSKERKNQFSAILLSCSCCFVQNDLYCSFPPPTHSPPSLFFCVRFELWSALPQSLHRNPDILLSRTIPFWFSCHFSNA